MSKRVMVVDDDETTRNLFEIVLTDEGCDVSTYDYAQIDLNVVRQLKPDLILLDLNVVQTGTGWTFLQLLKMEIQTAAIPVVICTTSSNLSLEIEGYLAARHISVVRKPFDIDDFILTVRNNFTPDISLPILLVEDNEDISEIVTAILAFGGYLTVIACNGLLALDAVAHAQYALILLDMSMPIMNGFEFLTAYAQQPAPHFPTIIVSGQFDLMKERLPEFVIGTLPKPFEVSHFLTLVSQYAQPVSGKVGP